jgi:putative DNA primase/helicase
MNDISEFIKAMERAGVYPLKPSDIKDTGGKSVLIKDRERKERIYYSLTLRSDFSFGNFFYCKNGENGYWYPKIKKSMSEEARAERQRLMDEQEAANKIEQEKAWQEARARAVKAWKAGSQYTEHPYLERKGIVAGNTRLSPDGHIIVPIVGVDGVIMSLQYIAGDGDKKLLYGGKKKGNFHPIGWSPKTDSQEIMVICEGFATGMTLADALALPVAVAIDSGNLFPVGQALRKKHKDCIFIYAADNDAWNFKEPRAEQVGGIDKSEIPADDIRWTLWKEKGYLYNDGIEKAKIAGVKTNGFVVWPEFDNPSEKLTDFNDLKDYDKIKELFAPLLVSPFQADENPDAYSVMDGASVEQIAVETIGESPESVQPIVIHGTYFETDEKPKEQPVRKRHDGKPEWYNDAIWRDEKTYTPEAKSLHNRILWLRNGLGKFIQYNEFSDQVVLTKPWPWDKNKDKFFVRMLDREDTVNLTAYFEQNYRLSPDTSKMDDAIGVVAKENTINPVKEYFKSLEWDGVKRLDTWLLKYLGATEQPHEYLSRVGTMWLVAGVARSFKAGTPYHHMIVLEGKQNIGKSRALKTLATFGIDKQVEYFTDGLPIHAINNPKSCQILAGSLIVEFAELEGMDKIGELSLRAWITKTEDRMIKNYAKNVSVFPRRYILAGTTNEDNWLRDSQGFRRYHPVKCNEIDIDSLIADKEQLWAEAVRLYQEGYSIYLPDSDPVYSLAVVQQQQRQSIDALDDVFDHVLDGVEWITYAELWQKAGMSINMLDEVAATRMKKYLRKKGWRYEVAYKLSKSKSRVWLAPDNKIYCNTKPSEEDLFRIDEVIDVIPF